MLMKSLKDRTAALKVSELAELFGVTPQHIYRMAANGSIPSFRIAGAIRFDPEEIADWLQTKGTGRAAFGYSRNGFSAIRRDL